MGTARSFFSGPMKRIHLPSSVQVRRVLKWALYGSVLLGGLGTTFLLSAYQTMRVNVTGRQIEVPNLVHLIDSEAREKLEGMKLRLDVTSERFDPREGKNRVLEQEPPAGAMIKPGRKVRVILSLGTRTLLVPELRGASARKAQISLQQEGLRLGDIAYVHSSHVEENQVIDQDPPASTPRQQDGRVNLLVSRGRREPRYVMPDLIGREIGDVKSFLKLTGMRIGQIREEAAGVDRVETVLRQYPPSGYPVGLRRPVTLVVGSAPGDIRDPVGEDDDR